MKDHFIIDDEHDLWFSQDDEDRCGKGWYITNLKDKGSQLFETAGEAIIAYKNNKLKYS